MFCEGEQKYSNAQRHTTVGPADGTHLSRCSSPYKLLLAKVTTAPVDYVKRGGTVY
jgi:hypothetical protein